MFVKFDGNVNVMKMVSNVELAYISVIDTYKILRYSRNC